MDRHSLARVMACERHYLEGDPSPFSFTVRTARTQVATVMFRRWAYRDPRKPSDPIDPLVAVHEVLDDIAGEDGPLGMFVSEMSETVRAEMAAETLNVFYPLQESWPDDLLGLRAQASTSRIRLLGGHLQLTSRIPLRFGRAWSEERRLFSSVILLDIRSGEPYEAEERPSRWYAALVELLKTGVAPERAATWYAETQEVFVDMIDDQKLEAAARRVADGVSRIVALRSELRDPVANPGWRCNYCSVIDSCDPGTRWRDPQRIFRNDEP